MLIPVCLSTDTMPRRTMHLHAIPGRTDSRSTRPHIKDASRARVPDVTRADGHERVIHNVRSFGWLHRRCTAPLSANHTKHTRHKKQSDLGRVMPWVVCPSSCRCGVLARIPQTCLWALFVFFSKNSVEWGCSSCMHTLWCCNATVNAECLTHGVVRFLVCCATFALSVGLLFFNAQLFSFGPCLFERVTHFCFDLSLRKFQFESTSSSFSIFGIFFQRFVTIVCFELSLRKVNFKFRSFFTFL